jgi:predicted ATPase
VTSRTPLRLSAEVTYPVPPLSLPDPARLPDAVALTQYPSVSLFLERAQAAKPDVTLSDENARAIAEICVRLDGLPLAIELAAAHVRALPPRTLLARLQPRLKLLTGGPQDLDARQRTMRATIDWSYDLLPQSDKTVFARLGVFVGGCRLEAAEEVCVLDHEAEIDVLESILSLVEKSVVQRREDPDGEPRFWMLETIGEYALATLEDEFAETAGRHALHYLGLTEAADTRGADQRSWITRLESDYENLRAALRWTFEHGHEETALRFVIGLSRFWESQLRRVTRPGNGTSGRL